MSKARAVFRLVALLAMIVVAASAGRYAGSRSCSIARDSLALATQRLDSVRGRLDTARARYYRARELYAQQVAVMSHIEDRMLYYAAIVARRPTSAKYMPAWTRRAFAEGSAADSVP